MQTIPNEVYRDFCEKEIETLFAGTEGKPRHIFPEPQCSGGEPLANSSSKAWAFIGRLISHTTWHACCSPHKQSRGYILIEAEAGFSAFISVLSGELPVRPTHQIDLHAARNAYFSRRRRLHSAVRKARVTSRRKRSKHGLRRLVKIGA